MRAMYVDEAPSVCFVWVLSVTKGFNSAMYYVVAAKSYDQQSLLQCILKLVEKNLNMRQFGLVR